MHEEEIDPVPLSPEEPEMGDGISAAPPARWKDYEIEDRVIAGNPSLGYTREELRSFGKNNERYQRLCKLMDKLQNEPPTDQYAVQLAKKEAIYYFGLYLRMRSRNTIRKEEIEQLEWEMYRELKQEAMERAMKNIQKIQALLGVENLSPGQGGKEFRVKLSGRPVSQAVEIARILQEPLVAPTPTSPSESEKTPS